MKRLASLAIVAILATGCVARIGDPMGPRTVLFLQRGVILQVTHTCTDIARVYQAGVGLVAQIHGATPQEIPMGPALVGDRAISVTVQSVGVDGKVVGMYSDTFSIDVHSTTARSWIISSRVDRGGWGRTSRCLR